MIEEWFMVDECESKQIPVPDLSVVVPLFNECGCVRELYDQTASVLDRLGGTYEIIFVDDGSSDSTYRILEEIAAADRRVKVVKFTRNFGQSAAMEAGFQAARAPITVTMDGDLQNDPEDIPALVAKLKEGYHLVCGWRKNRHDNLMKKKIPSWFANRLISSFAGLFLHDYGCTLRSYDTRLIKQIELYGEMHRFIPALVAREGGRVAELPVNHHARTTGESKYGLERVFKVLLDLFLLKFLSGYATRPLHFFGFFGVISIALGSFVGGVTLYERYVMGFAGVILVPLVLLVMFLILIGGQTILIGLLGEIAIRIYYESQGRKTYKIDAILNENV